MFVCCECHVLSGRGLCDELITRPEESYRLCCVVVCDLETSRIGAPYIYNVRLLRINSYVTPVFWSITQYVHSKARHAVLTERLRGRNETGFRCSSVYVNSTDSITGKPAPVSSPFDCSNINGACSVIIQLSTQLNVQIHAHHTTKIGDDLCNNPNFSVSL